MYCVSDLVWVILALKTFYPFNFSLSFLEFWNVTTFLGAIIMSSPVAGFRPLRSAFFLTQNFPKPEMRTSSPFSRERLMSSSIISTVSKAFCWVYPLDSTTASTMRALIRVPVFGIEASFHEVKFTLLAKGLFCQGNWLIPGFCRVVNHGYKPSMTDGGIPLYILCLLIYYFIKFDYLTEQITNLIRR